MVKCLECDLWQLGEPRGAGCRFCEGDLPKEQDGLQVPGEEALDVQACSWTQAVQWHEEEVRSHWQLKRMWMDQLNQAAVGAQQGSEHGGWLQVLEEQLMVREECLQRQHRALEGWRIAALQAAGGSGEVEDQKPSLVLQTYTVSLAQVRRELHKWVEPFKDEYVSLSTTTGAIFPTTEEVLKKDPRYPWREEAPAMLVPTVKSPHGRHRARVVICGNHLTKSQVETKAVNPLEASSTSSPFELYACRRSRCNCSTSPTQKECSGEMVRSEPGREDSVLASSKKRCSAKIAHYTPSSGAGGSKGVRCRRNLGGQKLALRSPGGASQLGEIPGRGDGQVPLGR